MFYSALSVVTFTETSNIGLVYIGMFNLSIFFMLMFPIYYFLFEYFLQKTPGKYLTKTSVINEYGNKLELNEAILRSIIRMVPFEAFSCLSDRGWHDEWSNTYLVSDEEYEKIKKLQREQS
jgi:uncharacterized RDD family membrane protein YckC